MRPCSACAGLHLIGFKDVACLKPWHTWRQSTFVYPDERAMPGTPLVLQENAAQIFPLRKVMESKGIVTSYYVIALQDGMPACLFVVQEFMSM